MSLVGMRRALGEALSNAASRKQVDAVIDLVRMVESDFEANMMGACSSAGNIPYGDTAISGVAARNVGA